MDAKHITLETSILVVDNISVATTATELTGTGLCARNYLMRIDFPHDGLNKFACYGPDDGYYGVDIGSQPECCACLNQMCNRMLDKHPQIKEGFNDVSRRSSK